MKMKIIFYILTLAASILYLHQRKDKKQHKNMDKLIDDFVDHEPEKVPDMLISESKTE